MATEDQKLVEQARQLRAQMQEARGHSERLRMENKEAVQKARQTKKEAQRLVEGARRAAEISRQMRTDPLSLSWFEAKPHMVKG